MALAADVAKLVVSLRLDDSGFSGKLNAAAASLNRMDAGLSQVGRGAGQVAGGLGRLATVAGVAAAGGLAAVVTTAASFEAAFTGVEKTVDGTEAQLGELEETIREMARTMPLSFEELAGIGAEGGALGIARDSLDEFIDVVARLSVSTNLTSDQAATALGQLGNVLHLTGDDFEDFADSLVALGNAGASTEDQIIDMAARFGAAGNAAGLSKEEILALSSAVASMGVEVEAGGSSLSRIFSNVATAIGTGSDDVEAFTELLGISADEFQKRWGEDALGTFQDFLVELNKLDQFGQARVLEEAGITSVRDINAVRLMAQNVNDLAAAIDTAENATGALHRESDKFFATGVSGWKTFKNIARDALSIVGEEPLEVLNEEVRNLGAELNKPEVREGLRAFGKDLATGIRSVITELKGTDFSGLVSGLRLTAEVAKGAFDAFRALPAPIQQLAIAALVANKVSGGAVSQIAKGLGNIAFGALKVTFPKLDIFTRGASAANPLWVQSVAGGIGGAPVAGGGGFGSGLLKGVGVVLGVAAAAELGRLVGEAIIESTVAPARDFETDAITKVLAARDPQAIQAAIDAIDTQFATENWAAQVALGFDISGVRSTLEQQRDALQALLHEVTTQGKLGGKRGGDFGGLGKSKGGSASGGAFLVDPGALVNIGKTSSAIDFTKALADIFGPGITLNPSQVIDLRDPIVAAQRRADQASTARLDGLASRLDVANGKAASMIQNLATFRDTNSGKLSGILGATQPLAGMFGSINGKLGGILAKNPVTTVNVTTPVYVTVGVSEIQYQVNSLRTTVQGGGYI